ncbi:CapA family protein [Viridibacillus sp. YIM B01967]|uniref:CapA family protein n=1 Tax=Viridibacillus soli TaxID=2798301 RepID=A0ABS1H5W5_9BACL|nr:CapA family protein [Viridibacillus soli]MBK3494800.1 CapA family protein [Viridibacillus soli]
MRKFLLLCCTLFLLSACSVSEKYQKIPSNETVDEKKPEKVEQKAPVTKDKKISVAMIGDVLLHEQLLHYKDYSPSFAAVEDDLQSYDFLLANQESMPVGKAFGLSGYPKFASPDYIVRDLKEAGVDFLTVANNHTLDHGEKGVLAALKNIESYGLPYVGAYKSAKDQQKMRIVDVKGIKIGILAYTYGTNGNETPPGKEYLVNRIDLNVIQKDIKEIRPNCDVVIVNMHWGIEYQSKPNAKQKQMAKAISNAGADIIFGNHPHVLQPYENIVANDGRKTHVFYSLGNFFAAQQDKLTYVGGIASLEVVKDAAGTIQVDSPRLIPTAIIEKNGVYFVEHLKDVEKQAVRSVDWVKDTVGLDE